MRRVAHDPLARLVPLAPHALVRLEVDVRPRLAVGLALALGRVAEQAPPLRVAHGRARAVPQRDRDEVARRGEDAAQAVREAAHADVVRRAARLGLEGRVEGRERLEVAGGLQGSVGNREQVLRLER